MPAANGCDTPWDVLWYAASIAALGVLLFQSTPQAQDKGGAKPLEASQALQLWSVIKRALMAPDGQKYFESDIKNAWVPGGADGVDRLRGTVISVKPQDRPSSVIVAISDRITPEVTLQIKDARWQATQSKAEIKPGTEIEFEGVPVAFTRKPFMLTFVVQPDKLALISKSLFMRGQKVSP